MKLNNLKGLVWLMAVATVAVAPVNAATNEMSLDDLVNEALANNPEMNFYRAEIAVAKGGRKSAGAWANPELTGEIGQKKTRDSSGKLLGDGAAWAVGINQTFEYPGRPSLRKAIANHDIQLAELGLAQFQAALAARVRALGYNIFIAQEKLAASSEVADRFQALTEVLVQRDPTGLTPLLETRIIEASTLVLQRQAGEATIAAQTALLELNQLRGQRPGVPVRVTVGQLDILAVPSLDSLLDAARTNAFELRARQVELEQQGFQVSLAKTERFSGITAGPFISQEKADEKETIVGLAISMPLPLWNRKTGDIETAKAREDQAQTSLLVTQRDVERRVMENALKLKVKLDEMSQWREDSAQRFHDAAGLADRHFRLGALPISTYVELQKQYLEAVEAVLETKKDALAAAQSLEQLTGLPLPLFRAFTSEEKK